MSGQYMQVPGGEADLGADRPYSYMSEGEVLPRPDSGVLLGHTGGIAPSIASRDSSSYDFGAPSIMGAPSIAGTTRSSWGSSKALGASPALPAGADYGNGPRVQSGLHNQYSTPYDDDEEQGHVQPNASVPGSEKEVPAWAGGSPPRKKRSRAWLWILLALLALIAVGVGLGVGLGIGKPWAKDSADGAAGSDHNTKSSDSSTSGEKTSGTDDGTPTGTSASAAPSATPTAIVSGGQGSVITFADGTNYTYQNPFGGRWYYDPADPLNNGAKCNDWTPALNETWQWGVDTIRGVNLGGWLNTEPFIVPGLYEKYPSGPAGQSVDEFTLATNMGKDLEKAMREHYDTFITEQDFAEIASAGLSWIRLPIPHWAVQTIEGEPYLKGVAWEYVLKAIGWARKYGLRINLDLHTVPGSQNGWNHSGRLGMVNFLNGPMGLVNAQRALDIIRTITQFIAQDQYTPVIQMFGFINEPLGSAITMPIVRSFYLEAYSMIRSITGIGAGNGPMLSVHDAFLGIDHWQDFARGADRLALDQHPYMVFQDQPDFSEPGSYSAKPCQSWGGWTNQTSIAYGPNSAGEFSAAINDCGLWVNGIGLGSRYDGTMKDYKGPRQGSCDGWNDYRTWDDATKANILAFTSASMDALQNFFFWTWKIGNSTSSVPMPNPFWHYRLGLQEGWIPKDPRSVIGTCAQAPGAEQRPFNGFTAAWMTGGDGAGQVNTADTPWPPQSFSNIPAGQMTRLPQYTQTANPITLPAQTLTAPGSSSTIDMGSGWANANDKRKAYAAVKGCAYPNEYTAADDPIPATACGAGPIPPTKRSVMERGAFSAPTAAP